MYSFKVGKMKDIQTVVHSAYDIWAAAVCAQRINKGYLKEDEFNADGDCTREANRTVARNALALGGKITVEEGAKQIAQMKDVTNKTLGSALMYGKNAETFGNDVEAQRKRQIALSGKSEAAIKAEIEAKAQKELKEKKE